HHVRKGELAPSFPERRDRSHLWRKGKAGPIISGNERPVPSFPDRKRSGGRSWTGKGQSIGARGKAGRCDHEGAKKPRCPCLFGEGSLRLGKLLRFLKPYRTHVWLIIALVLFQTLTELYLPALMASIVDQGVVTGDIGHIWRVGGMMMSVAAVGVAAAIWTTRISARTASAFGRDLRSSMFRRVTEFSMREFDELGTATLITRTTNDVTQVQQVLFMTLRMMVSAPLMAV